MQSFTGIKTHIIKVVYILGVLTHFGSKNQTRKIVKIHKDFEL